MSGEWDALANHQMVENFDGQWVGTCDHGGGELWTVHRRTARAAERSLCAHQCECPAYVHNIGDGEWRACSRPRPCLICVENDTPAEPRPTERTNK